MPSEPQAVSLRLLLLGLLNYQVNRFLKLVAMLFLSSIRWVLRITPSLTDFQVRITGSQVYMLVRSVLIQLDRTDKLHHRCMEKWARCMDTARCSNSKCTRSPNNGPKTRRKTRSKLLPNTTPAMTTTTLETQTPKASAITKSAKTKYQPKAHSIRYTKLR